MSDNRSLVAANTLMTIPNSPKIGAPIDFGIFSPFSSL